MNRDRGIYSGLVFRFRLFAVLLVSMLLVCLVCIAGYGYSEVPGHTEAQGQTQQQGLPQTRKDSLLWLLDSYTTSYSLEKANYIMACLKRWGAIEEKFLFKAGENRSKVQMNVWYFSADYMYAQQQYSQAINMAVEALGHSYQAADKDMEADIISLLAVSNFRLGNYDRAASYAEQCYTLDLESGDPDRTSSSLNTLAAIYMAAKRYPLAEKYVLMGIQECSKAKNKARLGVLLGMASEVYQSMGKSAVALDYAQQAYDKEVEMGRESQAMVRLSQKGAALIGLERYDEAEELLKEVIPYFRRTGNLQSLGISCNKMGAVLLRSNRKEEASEYYAEAADIFVRLGDPFNEMHSRKGLYESLLDFDKQAAIKNHDRYDNIKDSLYSIASAESLSRYDATIGNVALRLENLKAHRAKYTIIMLGILAVLLCAAGVWYIMYMRSRRQKAAMEATIHSLRSQYNNLRGNYNEVLVSQEKQETQAPVSEEESCVVAKADRAFLDKLVAYVLENMNSGKLGVESIASHMCLSSGHLNRRLKTITGVTTQNYVLRLRLEQAKILLQQESDAPVSDIAYRCGFEDGATFSRAFKRVFNCTPSQIRS